MRRPYSEAEIEAALKRMDAVLEIPEEVLEVAARAMYEAEDAMLIAEDVASTSRPWCEASEDERRYYREMARVALPVVQLVQAPVHLCDTCPGGLKCERKDDVECACADGPFPAKAIIVECELREKWIEYVKLLQKEDDSCARQGSASQG